MKELMQDPSNGFIQAMEEKINNLLQTKIGTGFKMINLPNGFHYGFVYGMDGYYNKNSLLDIDCTIVEDEETGCIKFAQGAFTQLYEDILEHTGYELSLDDTKKMEDLDQKSSSYVNVIIKLFKNHFPNASLDPDLSTFDGIFDFIIKKYGDFKNMPDNLNDLRSALMEYQNIAQDAYQLHIQQGNARNRLSLLKNAILSPNENNGALQTDRNSFYPAFRLPEYPVILESLKNENNQITINAVFSNFKENQSVLSIDHKASFIIPTPVCVFVKSDTKYTLNQFAEDDSTITMDFLYKGITTFSASPSVFDATKKGWYDVQILNEIVSKTNKDVTGYKLTDSKYDVKELFGKGKRFAKLQNYVVSQTPIITITMEHVNTNQVSSVFEHSSQLDISFFGFGISSSTHNYTVSDINVESEAQKVTITLSAPAPGVAQSEESEVCYLLGGTPDYPPEINTNEFVNLTYTYPDLSTGSSINTIKEKEDFQLPLYDGEHTFAFEINGFDNNNKNIKGIVEIWYYYSKQQKEILLCDEKSFEENKTNIKLCFDNNAPHLTNFSSEKLNKTLGILSENLISNLEKMGIKTARYRKLPEKYKNAYLYKDNNELIPLKSTLMGVRNICKNAVFVNASGTSNDKLYINGDKQNKSWIQLWADITLQSIPASCCNVYCSNAPTDGGHVFTYSDIPRPVTKGVQVDILPICRSCNKSQNLIMTNRSNIYSMVVVW